MTESAVITSIQGYSIHDGPGIRTVVFLKGCPLRCEWCANPENLTGSAQVGFFEKLCKSCGRCAQVCGNGAILPGDNVFRIDRERCVLCMKCIDACFYGALVRYGEKMTSGEVFEKVRRDKMFYDSSGGGITVSGGEPLLHDEFVRELFSSCREEEISTCVETCGYVPWKSFETVIPVTDYFFFDLKLVNNTAHEKYTGVSNGLILDNAKLLVDSGAEVLFRMPLIPGVNDTRESTEEAAAFIKNLGGGVKLQLMPYHKMGISKYAALSMRYGLEHLEAMETDGAEAAKELYRSLGVSCSISK